MDRRQIEVARIRIVELSPAARAVIGKHVSELIHRKGCKLPRPRIPRHGKHDLSRD